MVLEHRLIAREDLALGVGTFMDSEGNVFTRIPNIGFMQGASAPASGDYEVGDIVWNSAPVAGGNIGWVCIVAGSPGTWKEWGVINA